MRASRAAIDCRPNHANANPARVTKGRRLAYSRQINESAKVALGVVVK